MYLSHFSTSETVIIKTVRIWFLKQFLSCTPAFWCFALKSIYTRPSCAAQHPWPFHVSSPAAILTQMNVFLWKEPEWLSLLLAQRRNKQTPPAPLRKLVQAPPIEHKHHRVRSTNSLKKANHSAFHAESLGWRALTCTDRHKSGKVQSKWHTQDWLMCAYCCIPSKKCKKWMTPPQDRCPAMPAQVLSAASAPQRASGIYSLGTVGNVTLL